jgi:hypothetical protein
MAVPQVAMAALTGVQALGQIQNARFQANLAERQARDSIIAAESQAPELRLQSERERLQLAQEEVQKMRDANKTIAIDVAAGAASGALMEGNVFMNESLKNLSEDLNIIRTERDLILAKTKGQIGYLLASTQAQATATRAQGKAARQAGYLSAAGTLVKGGLKTYSMGPSSVTTPTGMEGPVNLGKGNI